MAPSRAVISIELMPPSALVVIRYLNSKRLHTIPGIFIDISHADGNLITMPPSNVHPQVNIRKKGYSAR
jgi:hypothetical protein